MRGNLMCTSIRRAPGSGEIRVSFVSIKTRMLEGLLPLQHYFSIAIVIAIISRIMAVIWRRMLIMYGVF